ncbi:MAG: mobile mystery protein B [Candidatus Omnitrophica bacterium]|nr:mobile mystery protein B [Candidatus Omnitrophota bacterium]
MAKDLKSSYEYGQTPLEDISGLLAPVKTREALNDLEAQNNARAYAKYFLFDKSAKKSSLLASQMLCDIHKDMFGEVWSWAGEFRKGGAKNIGVPALNIRSEIHRLISEAGQWEEKKMPPAEIAVRIHHRLVFIHPFENGNGRWARLVTNLYLHRHGLALIEWPTDLKIVREDFRPKYLAALKKADHGDCGPLLELHQAYAK